MKKFSKSFILFFALFFLCGCYTVPITNRPTLVLALPGQDDLIGRSQFTTKLAYNLEGEISKDNIKNKKVENVYSNLIEIANKESPIRWNWEIVVTENQEENAFCLPGGKIFIYTGELNKLKDDDELAAVIAHEMGHALARHGTEEWTFRQLSNIGENVAYAVVNPKYSQWIFLADRLSPFVFHWFNRYQEAEADKIGLILMAKAGYNPHKAVELWKRNPDYGYNLVSAWLIDFITLRDHPNATERAARLENAMDEADKFYAAAPIKRSQRLNTQSSLITSISSSENNVSVVINKPAGDGGTKALSNTSEITEQVKTTESSSELSESAVTQETKMDDKSESNKEKEEQ